MRFARLFVLTLVLAGVVSSLTIPLVTVGLPTTGIDFALTPGGSISGNITDAGSGAPLENIEVEIWNSSGSFVGSEETDSAGNYLVGGLTTGTYFATTSNFGFQDELFDDIPCPGGAYTGCTPTGGTPIAVTAGSNTGGVDFDLNLAGSISGTVLDVQSAPLGGISIYVFDSNGSFIDSSSTDGSGFYRVDGLPSGSYFVTTLNFSGYADELYDDLPCPGGGFSCDPTAGTTISVILGATTPNIDFVLDLAPAGSISGTLTETGTGNPIVGYEVEVYNSSGGFLGSDFTDGMGFYQVSGLSPGNVFAKTDTFGAYLDELYDDLPCEPSCTVTSGTPIVVVDQMDTPGIDFVLDPTPVGSISGTVTETGTGNPVSFISVYVYGPTGSFLSSDSTDGAGFYQVFNLPAGSVFVRTDAFGSHQDELFDNLPCEPSCSVTTGTPVVVVDQMDTPNIDFVLDPTPAGSLSGTVTETGTGNPVPFISVYVYGPTGSFLSSDSTDGAGFYQVFNLPPGNVFVRTDTFGSHQDELFDDLSCEPSCSVTTGTPVVVVDQMDTPNIDFALVPTPAGSISGTVIDAATLAPIVSTEVEVYNSSGSYLGNDFTDGAGFYQVNGLPPGTVFARTDDNSGHLDELYDNLPCFSGCTVTSGTPIVVVDGVTTPGIDFALDLAGSISGTVTDAVTGNPLVSVQVQIYNSGGGFVTSAFTNGAGMYTSAGLTTGNYFARTSQSQGYLDELYNNLPCEPSCSVTTGTPIAVSGGSVAVGLLGDCNLDGKRGAADFVRILQLQGSTTPAECDVDGNGIIQINDLDNLFNLIALPSP